MIVEYLFDPTPLGNFSVRTEYQYQSRIYFTEVEEKLMSQEGYDNFNLRFSWESADEHWQAALWERNVTDEDSISASNDYRPLAQGTVVRTYNPPRTFGIDLSYNY